jgi:hypothetical protein
LESTNKAKAHATWPGDTLAKAAVLSTQTKVVAIKTRFLAACRSAQAPMKGMVNKTQAYEALRPKVQASVAHGAPPATPPTKYAENTAVMTTVV